VTPAGKKTDLTNLLRESASDREAPAASAGVPAAVRPAPATPPAGKAAGAGRVRPKYAQIRGDQQTELDVLARELMDARTSGGRRITANTLIRVAIDTLLAQRHLLVGNDEEELARNYFKSLGIQESKTQQRS